MPMLKQLFINGKKIPVPVPVTTLDGALEWVHVTLVPEGHSITRVSLDGVVLDTAVPGDVDFSQKLSQTSKLELQVDSPVDLAVQTLEAVRNLAAVINTGIKQLAVSCWQAKPVDRPDELGETIHDLELVQDLLEHLSGIVQQNN